MGRAPCCDKANVKKGPWSPEEDAKLKDFIDKSGTGGNWIALPQKAGLKRCGKSCRLRWLNYLRPNIKHGEFSDEEDKVICSLYATIGSRWSIIAAQLPGRTDNDIKNYWNTKLKKKLMGIIPSNIAKPFSNTFQLTQYHSLSTLSQLYYQAAKSLSTVESIYAPQNFLRADNENFPIIPFTQYQQTQECLQYYNGKDNNILMFGGNEAASCSSSDGSCSYGKDPVKREYGDFQGFVQDNHVVEESQKFMLQYGDPNPMMMMNGFVDQNGSNIDNYSSNSLVFNDENKTDEREMYYY
ncbi:hypothetical protein ACS0TY_014846 [Phlomoides rotata]